MADSARRGGITRFALLLLGLAMAPANCALALAAYDLAPAILVRTPPFVAPEPLSLIAGYALSTILFLVFPPWVRMYVLGHELTHAIWGLLTGSKVGRIKVGSNGGYVQLSDPGVFTTLAPYFVPFYMAVVLLLRLIIGFFADMSPYALHWLFLVGMAYGFHVLYTVRSLMERQPDIREFGRFISYAIILMVNLVVFGYGIVSVTPATAGEYHQAVVRRTTQCYSLVANAASRTAHAAMRLADRGETR